MAILKPSRLGARPDINPIGVRAAPPTQPAIRRPPQQLHVCNLALHPAPVISTGTVGYRDGDKRGCQAAPADQVSSGIQSEGGRDQGEY